VGGKSYSRDVENLDSDFRTLMKLEPHGPDVHVGLSPKYPWGRVYGGQVVAQGLRAAHETVDESFRVHSLHAYFIRGGDSDEPIRYEVDRIRNGRSFMTRRVVARQSAGPILNLSASSLDSVANLSSRTRPNPPRTSTSHSSRGLFGREQQHHNRRLLLRYFWNAI